MKAYLERRIKHVEQRVNEYRDKENELSPHGKYAMGYWEGLLVAYENALDYLKEEKQ